LFNLSQNVSKNRKGIGKSEFSGSPFVGNIDYLLIIKRKANVADLQVRNSTICKIINYNRGKGKIEIWQKQQMK
jgi:hypothetical protein